MRRRLIVMAIGISATTVSAQESQPATIGQLLDISYRNRIMLDHIGATWDGISWMTAYMDATHGAKVLCIPGKLVVGDETARDFLARFIEEHPEQRDAPTTQLGYLLIQAGMDTFPCPVR